jgi:hypothetical protein
MLTLMQAAHGRTGARDQQSSLANVTHIQRDFTNH